MAISTMAAIRAALPGQTFLINKGGAGNIASVPQSGWMFAGSPNAGVAPTALNGHLLSSATLGGVPFANAGAGLTMYLGRVSGRIHAPSAGSAIVGSVVVYDRLWHNAVAATAGAQAIAPSAITRFTTGEGVECWWEVFVNMGAGTPTVTLTYTDQSGNVGATGLSAVLATTMGIGRTGPFSMASGDYGVRAVTGWNANATFTSGTIGAVLRRRIATIPVVASYDGTISLNFDAVRLGFPQVPNDACLEFIGMSGVAAAPVFSGFLSLVQG